MRLPKKSMDKSIRIAIFSFGRMDFGLFVPLIRELKNRNVFNVQLFVGGMHLEKSFGETIKQVHAEGFEITDVAPAISRLPLELP